MRVVPLFLFRKAFNKVLCARPLPVAAVFLSILVCLSDCYLPPSFLLGRCSSVFLRVVAVVSLLCASASSTCTSPPPPPAKAVFHGGGVFFIALNLYRY